MPEIDVTDEGVIECPLKEAYNTLLDELAGVTHWSPNPVHKLRGNTPIREGSIIDVTINPESRLKTKFSVKITKMVEGKSIEEELSGDLIGTGKWTFEPINGKANVQLRMNIRTHSLLLSLVSPFVNLTKLHSEIVQQWIRACNSYLSEKVAQSQFSM